MNNRNAVAVASRLPFASLALVIATFAFTLIVLKGSTTPAMNCDGWADCSGWSALGQRPGSVEAWRFGLSSAVGILAVGLIAVTRVRAEYSAFARTASIVMLMAALQLAATIASVSITVAPRAAAIHLGATALLLATTIYLLSIVLPRPTMAGATASAATLSTQALRRAQMLVVATTGTLFVVLVSGAYLSSASAVADCTQWPVCSSDVSVASLLRPDLALFHREMVLLTGALLIAVAIVALRAAASLAPIRWLVGLLVAAYVGEVAIGALSATGGVSRATEGVHFAVAGVVWVLLVGVAITVTNVLQVTQTAQQGVTQTTSTSVVRDYIRVMKPGIMLLLLTTTLGAMLVAGASAEWPSIGLVLATLLGGVLASGGASALNCYLDRDIDVVMARTRKRPLPTGRLTAQQVRNFGLILSGLAVIELMLLVNPLAAILALTGNLYYVVLYTRFLKRSTPQNIVIGGGAGAFPPLVGWAAVTGSLGLTPILLFALIYYWTPPHFWSLALLKARDYERAGIPMLPVTHGDAQTRKFILIYSFLLLGITLLLAPASGAGWLYLTSALLLGAVFVGYAAQMYREDTTRLAWPLFKYSNYYLALVLLALVVDRSLGI